MGFASKKTTHKRKENAPMKPLVTDLWPQFGEDSTFAASFAQVLVDRVEQIGRAHV